MPQITDTGWVIAGTGANVTGIGTAAWPNPSNVTADDDTASQPSVAVGQNVQMNYLVGSNFGLSVPATATILGIEARAQMRDATSFGFAVADLTHMIVAKDSGTLGSDLVTTNVALTSSFVDYTRGSASELWGLSWTPAEVNAADFAVYISAFTDNIISFAPGIPACDAIWVRVHYSAPYDIDQAVDGNAFDLIGGNLQVLRQIPLNGNSCEFSAGDVNLALDLALQGNSFGLIGGELDLLQLDGAGFTLSGGMLGLGLASSLDAAALTYLGGVLGITLTHFKWNEEASVVSGWSEASGLSNSWAEQNGILSGWQEEASPITDEEL